ncbi:MAG TPA: transcription elongation factor [Opitutaceae bacterium]|nr:transcription elongation factor [Opitutaceae bacterium]
MNKAALRDAIVARLEEELALQTAAANESREEATDSESRQEGKYDMRGQSAAYLAAGQAKLAKEIADAIGAFRALPSAAAAPNGAAGLGSVVTLEQNGQRHAYFLGPARGGLEVEAEGAAVTVVTPASALGSRLIGRRAGERILSQAGPPPRYASVLSVA